MGLDYPITRPFPQGWRWFTPLSLVSAFIALVFLCTINGKVCEMYGGCCLLTTPYSGLDWI